MESKAEDKFSWLFGLRSYFMFLNDVERLKLIKNIISIKYGKKEDVHHILKRVCLNDAEHYTTDYQVENRHLRYDYYFELLANPDSLNISSVLHLLNLVEVDSLSSSLQNFIQQYQTNQSVVDAFSKGQVTSKVWLTETLQKLINPNTVLNNIVQIGGWYGHLTHYLQNRINYDNFYNIDPHEFNSAIGQEFFNGNAKNYTASSAVIENIDYVVDQGYKIPLGTYNKDNNFKFNITDYRVVQPDLIINTSCEHMSDHWFHQIPAGKMIALQTNNLFDIAEDHFNCVENQQQLNTKYPMNKVLFQGELDITMGKRFMKIGIK
jgi:hypothetical protein